MKPEDIEYVGQTRPKVQHIKDNYLPEFMLEIEDGDHLRIDEQGYDEWRENE